ncbi:MAG: hypothetical protein JST54_03810 [Deltaproteobacteria bacterium]|nr:hypothetical protein [Deltaproteobacteria bacterium]
MANRRKLGELLVAAGVLDDTRLNAALAEQKKWGGKLGRILIDLGFVKEELMVKALSHQLQLPAVDLTKDLPSAEAISRVPVQLAEKYGVFPMAYDDVKKALSVATADPTNEANLRDMRMELNIRTVSPVVAGASDIDRAIRKYYYGESVQSVPTATPQHFGLSEQLIDLGVPAAGVIPGRGDGVSHMVDVEKLKEETNPHVTLADVAKVAAGQVPAKPAQTARPPSRSTPPPPPPEARARPATNGAAALPPPLAQPHVPGVAHKPPVLGHAPQGQGPATVFTAAAMVAARPQSKAVPAVGADQIAQLTASVQRMEQLLTAEVRSLRTLVEMLVEKGMISREEYLKRVRDRQ